MPLYYEKPFYYAMIHVLLGALSYYYSTLGIAYFIYQFGQLYFNKRVFLFQWKIENGNTFVHTLIKLGEFMMGWIIVYCISSR
jgi:hypothetical protein